MNTEIGNTVIESVVNFEVSNSALKQENITFEFNEMPHLCYFQH